MNASPVGARRLLRLGAAAAIVATVTNAVIYGIGRAAGIDFIAGHTHGVADHIRLVHVVTLTLVTFAIGLAVAIVVGLAFVVALQIARRARRDAVSDVETRALPARRAQAA